MTLDRLIRPTEAARLLGLSKSTLWRMRRRGDLPEPLKISSGAVGWRASTLEEWLDDRQAEAEAASPAGR